MKSSRQTAVAGLLIFAAFIWLRDRNWIQGAADTLPVLAVLPLYVWLARPFLWKELPQSCPAWALVSAAVLALGGIVLDLTVLLAGAWCLFLFAFLEAFAEKFSRRLLVLPFLGFPWIASDAQAVGWWFRYSGAGAAEAIFSILGFHVQREGTFLVVQGLPLAVDAACSGLNVLQAMWITGFVVIFLKVPPGARFWGALACLVPLAWLANTARIFTLGIAALSFGADFAMGWFHQWGGLTVLLAMFALSQWGFGWFARGTAKAT